MEQESNYSVGDFMPSGMFTCTLDGMKGVSTMSVYCSCGRIVIQDRAEMKLRLSLRKELECSSCRNRRISHEIDVLNMHYEGLDETEELVF